MHYLKRMTRKNGEDGVSPVVGVMLMLVVTIIIAAVVSGFAGGLVGGQQKSPTLSMDVKITNTGSYVGSGFSAQVNSVSEPINTANIRIITTWTTTMKNNVDPTLTPAQRALTNGTTFSGGNTTIPRVQNVWFNPGAGASSTNTNGVTVPFGMGSGINTSITTPSDYSSSYFGQYSLVQGVGLYAYPYGSATVNGQLSGAAGQADTSGYNGVIQYAYASGTNFAYGNVDPAMAVLGTGWNQLRAGDIVHVKAIYIPTGATIFNKDVAVTEG